MIIQISLLTFIKALIRVRIINFKLQMKLTIKGCWLINTNTLEKTGMPWIRYIVPEGSNENCGPKMWKRSSCIFLKTRCNLNRRRFVGVMSIRHYFMRKAVHRATENLVSTGLLKFSVDKSMQGMYWKYCWKISEVISLQYLVDKLNIRRVCKLICKRCQATFASNAPYKFWASGSSLFQ